MGQCPAAGSSRHRDRAACRRVERRVTERARQRTAVPAAYRGAPPGAAAQGITRPLPLLRGAPRLDSTSPAPCGSGPHAPGGHRLIRPAPTTLRRYSGPFLPLPWRSPSRRRHAEMVYRIATMGEPKTLDPHGVSGTWENYIVGDAVHGPDDRRRRRQADPGRGRELDDQRRRARLHLQDPRPQMVGRRRR